MKKRIALAAVAALAGGLIVAAPASAVVVGQDAPWSIITPVGTWGTDSTTATVTQVASAGGYVAITAESVETTTATGSWVAVSGSTIASHTEAAGNDTATVNAAATQISYAGDAINGNVVRIATSAVGTITVTAGYFVDASGVITSKTQQTFTITVVAAAASSLYDHTKVSAPETASVSAYVDAAGAVLASKGTAGAPAAVAKVTATQYANAAETTETADGSAKAWTATITGVGLISEASNTTGLGTYLVKAAATNNVMAVYVYSDGRAGVATITFTVDGVAQAAKTVTFYGAGASYEVTNNNPHIALGETGTVTVLVKDANGVVVPGETVNAVSATAATATVEATKATSTAAATLGKATLVVTSVAAGTSVLTFRNAATAALATVTKDATVKVTKATIASAAMAFDKAEYAPGEKAVITVTLKDANGDLIGDLDNAGTWAVFTAAATSTQAVQGTLPAAAIATASGVKTYTVYMPLVAGSISVSATLASALPVETALQGTTVSASAKVVAPVDATVTAINAKVASTEATVAALQVTVASVIKSLKVQWWLLKKIAVKVGIKLG